MRNRGLDIDERRKLVLAVDGLGSVDPKVVESSGLILNEAGYDVGSIKQMLTSS